MESYSEQTSSHANQINDLEARLAKVKKGLRNHQIVLLLVCVLWIVRENVVYFI